MEVFDKSFFSDAVQPIISIWFVCASHSSAHRKRFDQRNSKQNGEILSERSTAFILMVCYFEYVQEERAKFVGSHRDGKSEVL